MSKETLNRLESYKKTHKLSDVSLSKKLCDSKKVNIYPIYIYRWRKTGRIIGVYEKIVEDFLKSEEE